MTVRRLFAWLLLVSLTAMAVRETLDPDMWWHLRTGEAILTTGIPRQDIFSFTVPHHIWVTHEWLSQVIMWLTYQAGGFPALILFFALLTALTFWLVYVCSPGRPYLTGFVVLLAAVASAIVWGARPQMFNLLLMAVFIYGVERVRQHQFSLRVLWLLPPLTAVWANLHSGYLLGVVLLGTYATGALLDRLLPLRDEPSFSRQEIGMFFGVTAVSFLASALNPNGPELWIYPFETLGSPAMQAYIQEWHSPNFHARIFWPFAALLALGLISWVASRRSPNWTELLLFMGTGAAGLLSARHIPLFALVAVPIVSRHLAFAAARQPRLVALMGTDDPAPRPLLGRLNWLLAVLALAAAMGWSAQKIAGNETAVAEHYPVAAVDVLAAEGLAAAPGYNTYNWGGYLIWRGVPVFVDGRADVYGDDFLFYYLQAFEVRSDWQAPLNDFDVAYVLMEKNSPLLNLLLATGEWQTLYSDNIAQIVVRAPADP